MTKFLGFLLAVLLCGLCGLCAVQWQRETDLRSALGEVDARLKEEQENRVKQEDKLVAWEKEIKHLTARIDEQGLKIAEQEKANNVLTDQYLAEKKRAEELAQKLAATSTTLEQGQGAIQAQNAAVTQQNETIRKQNQMLRDVAAERDAAIAKYNAQMKEFNELVAKYNALAKSQ